MRIVLEQAGLSTKHWWRTGSIEFTRIAAVSAEKIDKVTYDEVFLIVQDAAGDGVHLGELDKGFAEAEQALRTRLPGFPADWLIKADDGPVGARTVVWPPATTKPT